VTVHGFKDCGYDIINTSQAITITCFLLNVLVVGTRYWIIITKGRRRLSASDYTIGVCQILQIPGVVITVILGALDMKGERKTDNPLAKLIPILTLSEEERQKYIKVC
jgi:hypothetical protein